MPRGVRAVTKEEKEKLIELVRQNASLYDVRMPEYKDAQQSQNIWDSISRAMAREDFDGE